VSETTSVTPKLTMARKISTWLGANSLTIEDTVENEGHTSSPFMMLYHFNFGFPLVSGETQLLSPTRSVVTMARENVTQPDLYRRFQHPTPRFQDSVFRHEVVPDADGYVTAALVNKGPAPFGAYVRYRWKELPHLWQWKMLAQGVYTVALEPANCWIEPRSEARKSGELKFLEPGQVVSHHLEIGVCASKEEVEGLENSIPSFEVEP
jgi:galactose mutarotase-like enzyme